MKTRNLDLRRISIIAGLLVLGFCFVAAAMPRESSPPTILKIEQKDAPFTAERARPHEFSFWRVMGALILTLGGLYGVSWYLKNRSLGMNGAKKHVRRLQVIERLPIDQKRGILLVRMDDRELLLGIGADQITNLTPPAQNEDFERIPAMEELVQDQPFSLKAGVGT